MLVLKCDRVDCGKFYEPYGDDKVKNSVMAVHKYFSGNIANSKSFDLCPECMQEFQKFIGVRVGDDTNAEEKDPN